MKNKLLLILLLVIFTTGCQKVTTGDDALKLMSSEQQKFILKLESEFNSETTLSKMESLLGEPYRGNVNLRVEWYVEENTKILAYFSSKKLRKIKYVSIEPSFNYEIEFTE